MSKTPSSRSEKGSGSVFQRSNGRWVAQVDFGVIDGKRVRKLRYAKTERIAKRLLNELLEDSEYGLVNSTESLTVAVFLNQWLEQVQGPKLAYLTRQRYGDHLRLHIVPQLGHLRLKHLNPMIIQEAMNRLSEKGLSPATVRYSLTVLRAALKYAIRCQMLRQNPALAVESPSIEHKEKRALNDDQAAALWNALQEHRLFSLFFVAAYTGLRQGELLALRWADINFEDSKIHVRHSLYREDGKATLKQPKSRKSRRVHIMPSQVVEVLAMRKSQQDQERLLEEGRWEEQGFIFTTKHGRPLNGTNVSHRFRELQEQAGLSPVSFHELRHTYGSIAIRAGVPLPHVSELMGHSQISVTADFYSHFQEPAQKDAARKIGRVIPRLTAQSDQNSKPLKRPRNLN